VKTLLVLGGPTASGKTKVAIEWALKHNTEILSADSRQCYTELNIGVAKPSKEELQMVKHHFVHSHSIHENVSAGDYERFGLAVLEKLFQTKDTVICTGGTGLYIKALCDGMDEMPTINEEIKMNSEYLYGVNGLAWLQEEVKKIDPLFFNQAEQQNPTRLLRALIFKLSTDQSIIDFRKHSKKERPFEIKKFYLAVDRPLLYERINNRVDQMLQDGLEEEVRNLSPYKHIKNLQTVGYQELFSYFDGSCSYAEAVNNIKQHTRHYAKRQLTWFQNQEGFEKLNY
jgi:tRNA dimethylallyltransferase